MVMFTSITWFTSLDAVRGFAGAEYEQAVVEDAAKLSLSRWDERVSHHELVADVRQPRAGRIRDASARERLRIWAYHDYQRWSRWRRRHQARPEKHHYQRRQPLHLALRS
jgi:hypothetical protein